MKIAKLSRLIAVYFVAFLLIILVSFYIFSTYITEIATETSNIRLHENAYNNITSVATMFNKDVVFLESVASTVSASGKITSEGVTEILAPLLRYTSFRRLAVDLPSGESYTSDGYSVNVSDMGYLEEALQGKPMITPVTYTLIEKDRCIAIVVPITQNGSVVGTVRGVYTADDLMNMVALNTFDGAGSFGLIDKRGNHISIGSPDTILQGDNSIFISMQSFSFAEGYTLDKIRDDMIHKRSGYTIYNNNRNTIHNYYTPIGIGDWYAISSTTNRQMGAEKRNIETAAQLLLGVPILLFGLVLTLIGMQNRQHRRKLEQEQEHLRNILDNIPLPLFITDLDKRLEFVNYAAETLFGRDRDNLLGKPCYILGTSRCANADCTVDLLLQSKIPSATMVHQGSTYQTTSAALASGSGYIHALQDITPLMEVQRSLEKLASDLKVNEEMYRIAASHSQTIIIDYNIETKALVQNHSSSGMVGVPAAIDNACETIISYGMIAPDYVDGYRDMFRKIDEGVPNVNYTALINLPDGKSIWNRISFTSVFDSEGRATRSIGIIEDTTAEQEERFRHERESRFRSITLQDSMLNYEIDLTHHRFLSGHEGTVAQLATSTTDDFDTVRDLLLDYLIFPEDRALVASHLNLDNFTNLFNEGINRFSFEYRRNVFGSDKPVWTEGTFYMFIDDNDGIFYGYGTVRDISQQKQRELVLKQKAELDLLTGLYNKITTETLISEHLAQSDIGSLMIIDLDNFKAINDTFGHALGDAVLSETARHLTELFTSNSIVGRIGGDEFAVFLTSPEDVEMIDSYALATCEMFRSSYTGIQNRKLSGTVGVALAPTHGSSFAELYRHADIALYNAKGLGKDTYSIYHEGLTQIALQTTREDSIDLNAGKVFSENITEFVLRILYESSDTNITINGVLELLCKHFHFGRSYIFELNDSSQFWVNTYEWCDLGVASCYSDMHRLAATTSFVELFDQDGIYKMHNLDEIRPPFNREGLVARGVQSMLHFAIYQQGRLCAHIGFDDCTGPRTFDDESVSTLRYTATLLGNFLLARSGGNSDDDVSTEEIEEVLDSINNFIYIINKDTHQVRYVNARTRNLIPSTADGGLCYKILRGNDAPCADCPVVTLQNTDGAKVVSRIYNELYDLWVDTTVSKISWKGDQHCVLINCNDVDE